MSGDGPSIIMLGCGAVTANALGGGDDVLSSRPPSLGGGASYCRVPDELLERGGDFGAETRGDHASWMAAVALAAALADGDISLKDYPPERVGLVLGSAFAGQLGMIDFAEDVRAQSARFVSPIRFPQTVGNYVAGAMSRAFGIHGPNLTVACGAASGLAAVATACSLLVDGSADLVIAGGFEALSDALVRGMTNATSGANPAAPWAEGACLYVLVPQSAAVDRTGRAIIRRWNPSVPTDGTEIRYDASDRVGSSLAAESAMRLFLAVRAESPDPVRTVVQPLDDRTAVSITVEV